MEYEYFTSSLFIEDAMFVALFVAIVFQFSRKQYYTYLIHR